MGIISNETVKFWQANAKSVQYYIDLPYKKTSTSKVCLVL